MSYFIKCINWRYLTPLKSKLTILMDQSVTEREYYMYNTSNNRDIFDIFYHETFKIIIYKFHVGFL